MSSRWIQSSLVFEMTNSTTHGAQQRHPPFLGVHPLLTMPHPMPHQFLRAEILEAVHVVNNQTFKHPINVAIWNMHLDVDWNVDYSTLLSTGLVAMGRGGGFR